MTEFGQESRALPIVTCAGPPEERGAQHGEALRAQIAQGLGAWSDAIGERHGTDPDAYIRQFVQGTHFLDSIRRWTPDLEAEIAGIARGAKQPWEWIYAYNLLDEEWTWARQVTAPGRGCTVVGLTREGSPPLLAQTMDIPRVHDGTQAVLRFADETGLEMNVFTYAGMVGLTGCNSAGVALVVNNLDMLPGSLRGLPVGCVIRGILHRATLQAATEFALQVPHATGQHYGMASPDGVASVEGWANGAATGMDDAILLHTNHPLYADEPVGDVEARYQWSRTRERLAFVESGTRSCQDVPSLQRLLADRTVPVSVVDNRGGMTFGAVIYECMVPPQMWVTPGPPHQYAFHHVTQERAAAAV
ncbi:MAG: C45 family peptidase [Chloroflexota bacterium]|nr:C45 family peptidase [Chloroflexota bacterium]